MYKLMLVVAMVAGLVGGFVSGRLFAPDLVTAQEAAKRAKVIEAETIRLVEPDGRVRAAFEILPDGTVRYGMVDKQGAVRLSLVVDGDGNARLDLRDTQTKPHATVLVNAQGSPSLIMRDKKTESVALLGEATLPISVAGIAEERPAGSLVLLNKEGRIIWRAPH